MSTMTYSDTLTILRCGQCQIVFAVPRDFDRRNRETGGTWYCPHGHSRAYIESDNDRLQKERDKLARQLASREEDVQVERSRREHAENRVRTYKGVVTKTRKRAAKGLCPVPGCRRSFVNVTRHVEGQHPEYVAELHAEGDEHA